MLLSSWARVVALSLSQLVAWGSLYYAYAVLSVPMAQGLGLSRELVAAAFSLALVASGFAAGPVGRMMDRHGARRALRLGAVLGPLSLGSIALATGALSLLASFACLGVAFAVALYDPALRAIVEWRPEARDRSRALVVLTSIGGFASTVFLPLTVWLVEELGWRRSLLALAALLIAVSLPVALALPGLQPTASMAPPSAIDSARSAYGAGLLTAAFALQALASTGVAVCIVWHLVAEGVDLAHAAAMAGLMGAAQVPGRVLLGVLQRALPSGLRLPLLFLVQAAALFAIARPSGATTNIAIVVFGATSGAMTIERATVIAEWFGVGAFGHHNGRLARASSFAKAAAPFMVEVVHQQSSYRLALGLLASALALGGALLLVAWRGKSRVAVP